MSYEDIKADLTIRGWNMGRYGCGLYKRTKVLNYFGDNDVIVIVEQASKNEFFGYTTSFIRATQSWYDKKKMIDFKIKYLLAPLDFRGWKRDGVDYRKGLSDYCLYFINKADSLPDYAQEGFRRELRYVVDVIMMGYEDGV